MLVKMWRKENCTLLVGMQSGTNFIHFYLFSGKAIAFVFHSLCNCI